MFLGGAVALIHTSSVIAVGLVALSVSHDLVPGLLAPSLQVISSALAVLLDVRLVRARWRPHWAQSGS